MSDEGFFGPALPPGYVYPAAGSQSSESPAELSGDRKRRKRHASSSSSSSGSSHCSPRSNGDNCEKSEKEEEGKCEKSEKEESEPPQRLFGPKLPAELSNTAASDSEKTELSFIGPVLPPTLASTVPSARDSDGEDVGPSLDLNAESKTQSTIEQIESRAQRMKDKLEGKDLPGDAASLVKKREEWMVELPPEMTKNFGVTARKFSTKTPTSGDKDRSAWTDTPADRARKEQELLEGKEPKAVVEEEQKMSVADQSYREQVDEYNRLSRPKSLLEMHEEKREHKSHHKKKKKKKSSKDDDGGSDKKRKKSSKKKKKKRDGKEEKKPERRPFDREKDLTVSKMDDSQRKSVINRSKELGGKFGHGATQFL